LIEPRDQIVDLPFVAKIDNACVNAQVRVAVPEFVTQLIQSLLASRDENERSRACRQLAGKLATDSSGSAGD
jgi:hypothetical protein